MKRSSLFVALISVPLLAAEARAQAPTLVPATLRNISPAGVVRGKMVSFTLDGLNLAGAATVVFDDPAITGTVAPGANRNQVKVTAVIGETATLGVHRVFLHTPLGTTAAVTFAVGAWPEIADTDGKGAVPPPVHALPATFVGALGAVGDTDEFRFQAPAGRHVAFQVVASPIRSRLQSVLALLSPEGAVLAEAQGAEGQPDAVLAYRFELGGVYTLRLRDLENAGGADVTYRVNAVELPVAERVFPLGFRKGDGEVLLTGPGLGDGQKVAVSAERAGTLTLRDTPAGPLLTPVRLAVGEEPEVLEQPGPNDTSGAAQVVGLPATVNGRIDGPGGDADCFRFTARKGQNLVVEVNARRLGSPLDSVIEVLDGAGKRIERATLRPVAETVLTLRDRDSADTGLRMLTWNDFAVRDYVYIRGELTQLVALPRGPDDDARFRSLRGQRVGLLDTTPTAQALNAPLYKVQIHPPGRTFAANGMPLFRLYYRNDDGGPLYGKDSRLSFTPPADGEYVVRIADLRGESGPRHAYRLTLREARPGFLLSLATEHPNVPAGASVPVDVSIDRLDGFEGRVAVRLENLPPGITATSTTLEAGEASATLLLTAAAGAQTAPPGAVRLVGEANFTRSTEPGGGRCVITVLPKPDLTVRAAAGRVRIEPGAEQHVDVSITRENGFTGRVPVEIRNLPFGVRVLDVGLNGVLIPEGETSRRFTLIAEPWVQPMERVIYCDVRTETGSAASTEVGVPVWLEVRSRTP